MFALRKRVRCRRVRPHISRSCLLAAWIALAPAAQAQQAVDEYAIKAAFLLNFTKFVEIPQPADAPNFLICIFGEDPFGAAIDQVVKGKTANGRAIQVRRLKEPSEARQCQIAFVQRDESSKAAKVIQAAKGAPVLLVGEQREFTRIGGTMYFSMNDNHVGVVVNPPVAERAGLKISAKLLSVAKIFDKNDQDER